MCFQDLIRYTGGGGVSAGSFYHAGWVPGESPNSSSKQVLLDRRLGVALTTKPDKTAVYKGMSQCWPAKATGSCWLHGYQERKKATEICQDNSRQYVMESLQYVPLDRVSLNLIRVIGRSTKHIEPMKPLLVLSLRQASSQAGWLLASYHSFKTMSTLQHL